MAARLIDLRDGPDMLVRHSCGGSVITGSGAKEQVGALVCAAGFDVDGGRTLADLLEGRSSAAWQAEAAADAGGWLPVLFRLPVTFVVHGCKFPPRRTR